MSETQQPKESGKSKSEIVPAEMLEVIRPGYKGSDKLKNRVAIITGGDSGIGKSVAVHYAKEGADVAIVYHESDDDANETKRLVEAEGRKCILLKGDIASEDFCKNVINDVEKNAQWRCGQVCYQLSAVSFSYGNH